MSVCILQGVVTYMSPVKALATGIRFLTGKNCACMIAPSKVLDRLIFYGSKVRLQPHILGPLIFIV